LVRRIVALAENLLLGKMLSSRVFNDAAATNTCMVNICSITIEGKKQTN
jgi:hypothetical protein